MGQLLLTAAEFVTGVCSISAYDIYYGHIPRPANLPLKPALVILDSGGYEVSNDHGLSAIDRSPVDAEDWAPTKFLSVLDKWPASMPAVFVSYDHEKDRKSFSDQVAQARDHAKGRQHQLHCFLIKPETEAQQTLQSALSSAIADANQLAGFDIVGVTEKELGPSLLDRMVRIARLRRALDEAGLSAPIHVFGSLDPISPCLYFLAGAEIFDGLTWIRYAFSRDGSGRDRCVYIHNHAALEYGIHCRVTDLQLRMMSSNYYYLEDLQERMKDFAATGDFTKLPNSKTLIDANDSLSRRLSKGGT